MKTILLIAASVYLCHMVECRPQQNSDVNTLGAVADSTTTTTTAAPATTRIPPGSPSQIVTYVSCPCPFTSQYSPVCGTDGRIYGNMGVLQCAKRCGTKVDVYLIGACGFNNG